MKPTIPSLGRMLLLARQTQERGLTATFHLYRTAPLIWNTSPFPTANIAKVPVHVLTGEASATMTAWMLTSLFHASQLTWPVVIHSDGSLSETTKEKLTNLFPTLSFPPSSLEKTVAQALNGYPLCQEYRNKHPLAKKCFDIPVAVDTPRFLILDSDVLFFRSPIEILQWVNSGDNNPDCWFNADFQEPSPVLPQEAEAEFGSPLWPKVNSGLCLLRSDAINFADHEHFLTCDRLREGNPWRVEQSLLALSASKAGHGGLLPSTYEVSPNHQKADSCIVRHYVGEVRKHFYREGIASLSKMVLST